MKSRRSFHFILLIFLVSLTLFTPSIANFKIGKIYEVSSPSLKSSGIFGTCECYYPQIYIDFENNIHTTWTLSEESDGMQKFILDYSKKPVNSTHWSDIKTLYAPIENIFEDAEFVIDKKENLHLVWKEDLDYSSVYYRYWNTSKNKWNPIETISDFNKAGSSKPRILVDNNFNAHIVWCDSSNYSGDGFEPNLLYRCKNATHGTWQSIEILTLETNSSMRCNPTITFDSDYNIAVAWIDESEVLYKLRYNNNGSWTNSSIISTFSGNDCEEPKIACDAANNIHFTWMEWAYHREVHYAKYIRNTSQIFHKIVYEGYLVDSPTMVLDQYGNIHIAWEDGSSDDVDIWYRYKNVSSETWSNIEIASKESTSHSTYPSISIGTNDILHFVWSDLTDYNKTDYDFDIFYKSKNLTSGEWSTTIVLSLSINYDPLVQLIYILLGASSVILIASLAFIIIRKRKNIISKKKTST